MVRLQLLFVVSEVFHLLLHSIDFKMQLSRLCLLLQGEDLLIGLGFFLAHLGMHQFLVQELIATLQVFFSPLELFNELALLVELVLELFRDGVSSV